MPRPPGIIIEELKRCETCNHVLPGQKKLTGYARTLEWRQRNRQKVKEQNRRAKLARQAMKKNIEEMRRLAEKSRLEGGNADRSI